MGAKLEWNSYMPSYYHMKDMNDDMRSTMWSQLYEDSRLNGGKCYNDFMQHNMHGYLECEKEALRETMLKHEAMFRKQVSELHHLYQVQKELMVDLKREGMNHCSLLPMETMHSGQSFSRFDDSQRGWKMSLPMPSTSSSGHRESTSDTDNMQLPLSLLKDNDVQVVSLPEPVLGLTNDSERGNSKRNNSTLMSIDLQLPADMYIDVEDRELSVEEIKVQDLNVVPESEVKLTLGTGCDSSPKENGIMPDKHIPNGFHSHEMAKSNDTPQGPHTREVSTSTYGTPGIFHDGFQPRHHSWKLSPTSIPIVNDHNKDGRRVLHLDPLESECKARSMDWHFTKPGMGNNGILSSSLASQYTDVKQLGMQKSLQLSPFLFPEHGQKDLQFPDLKLQNQASMDATSARALTVSSSLAAGPSSLLAHTGSTNASAEVSSMTKFLNAGSHLPFGISSDSEAFVHDPTRQQFDKSSISLFQRADTYAGKYPSSIMKPYEGFCNGYSHQNGFNLPNKTEVNGAYPSFSFLQPDKPNLKVHDFHDVKLNRTYSSSMTLPKGFGDDGRKIQVDLFSDKGEYLVQSSQWKSQFAMNRQSDGAARTSGARSDKGLSRVFGHHVSSIDLEEPLKIKKIKSETEMISEGSRSQPNCRAIFASIHAGNSDLGVVSEVRLGLDLNEPFTIDLLADLSENRSKFDCSEKQLHIKGFTVGYPECQNIEKETRASHTHEPYACQQFADACSSLHKGKNTFLHDSRDHQQIHAFPMEPLVIGSVSSTAGKVSKNHSNAVVHASEETPAENGPNLAEHIGNPAVSNTSNASGKVTKKNDLNGESGVDEYSLGTAETMATMAAEVLKIISAVGQDKQDIVALSNRPEAPLADSLKWFASVVCSDAAKLDPIMDSPRARSDDHHVPYDAEDDFEMMTLMLKDTKMDEEYCSYLPPEKEDKGPDTDASPAQHQPCRRSRRGRRQKDFQREILPGLMSLSRHEVTEDMQTIGCLLRFSGCQWQPPTLARKNGYRSEWNSPTRGRRSRCIAMELGCAVPPVLQPAPDTQTDRGVGLKSLTWGKTTTRLRRVQRYDATAVPTS